MIFVDTGHLIALARPTDSLNRIARAWAAEVGERLLVTHYVLVEALNELSHPADRPRADALLNFIRNDDRWVVLSASDALFEAGIAMHRTYADKAWSLTDCISFVVMRQRGIYRALAFDHHFSQAGFEPLLRREPK
jgi:predicted nucleic acid-binding protein